MKLKDLNVYAIGDTIQMVGALYADDKRTYVCMFPGERNDLPQEILEMDQDDWKKFLFQTDVLETEILEKASDGTLAKAIVRKSQRQIDAHLMWRVWRRDDCRCRYCGADDVALTVDHLIVWEEGGPTVPENLISACKKCNKLRGNKPYEEWLQHPYYRGVSKMLSREVREQNFALVATLGEIPRYMNRRSR